MTEHVSVNDLLSLKGRVAIVSGGGRGIGEAICLRFGEAGAKVAVVDVDAGAARSTAEKVQRAGGQAEGFGCDVADPAQVAQTVAAAEKRFGPVDILVNNAGIFPFSPVDRTTPSLWRQVLSVNLDGAFYLAQAAAKSMRKDGGSGCIVNVASVDAFHPTGNLAHYDASKGGLVMLTRALALELGPQHIRVNAVAPGSINTPGASASTASALPAGVHPEDVAKSFLAHIPLGRMGEPDEIAKTVLFLASPAASYVNGATLVADGGYLVG